MEPLPLPYSNWPTVRYCEQMKKRKLVLLLLLLACLASVSKRPPVVRFKHLSSDIPVPIPTITLPADDASVVNLPANYPQYDGISGLLDRGDFEGGETYRQPAPNPNQDTKQENTTTFSIDVDTASYANIRRYLRSGSLPPQAAVRVEEMVNYFHYEYPQATGGRPISVSSALGDCPWDSEKRLLRIGLQGRAIPTTPPRNLVLLVDVSGSMNDEEKLPLLRKSLWQWVEELRSEDTVSIVTYAGESGVALPPTSGDHRQDIRNAVSRLNAEGSTNGASGILTAYQLAREHFQEGAVNRVILATDGDFNFGLTDHDDLIKMIEAQRNSGIYLSVLGLGQGNINDYLMEQLADHGNGNYAYLDSIREARRVLTCQGSSTLIPIADDVKVQVEFDPSVVSSYRQVGYENRALANKDFRDDRKDAGDLGASQQVTALYEVQLKAHPDTLCSLGDLRLRYKVPGDSESREFSVLLRQTEDKGEDFLFQAAVAEMGLALQGDKRASLRRALLTQRDLKFNDYPWRAEFRTLLQAACELRG